QGRLARSGWAEDADEFAACDPQAHAGERDDGRLCVVALRRFLQLEDRGLATAIGGHRAEISAAAQRRAFEAHVDGTTTRSPGATLGPLTWTRPAASSKRPSVTGTR